MDQLLHRGFALAAATTLVGAGLLATSPTTPIAVPIPPAQHVQHVEVQLTDVFGALTTNIDGFFTDTWAALTSLAALHLSVAGEELFSSWLSLLYMPENLTVDALAVLTSNIPIFYVDQSLFFSADVLGALWTQVTHISNDLFSASGAIADLFESNLTGAYNGVSDAFNTAVLVIPGELIVGTAMSLGL